MKLSECLPNVLHAETIEEKAINLLNHPTALVLLPTTQVTAEKEQSYLAEGRSTQETYKITISARSLVRSLQGFQIFQYLQLPCYCFRKRKEEKRREKNCTQENLQPFTLNPLNLEPLILTQVKAVPIGKNVCAYCQNEFPWGQLAIVPFDIVMSHRERWLYLNRNYNADSQTLYIASSVKKLTNKYCCIVL